jgi:hypothetical protein
VWLEAGIPAGDGGAVLAGVKAGGFGWPSASLDSLCRRHFGPGSGRRRERGRRGVPFGWSGGRPPVVVPGMVQDQFANQLAGVAVDRSDVQVVDQQADRGASQSGAEADVV